MNWNIIYELFIYNIDSIVIQKWQELRFVTQI